MEGLEAARELIARRRSSLREAGRAHACASRVGD